MNHHHSSLNMIRTTLPHSSSCYSKSNSQTTLSIKPNQHSNLLSETLGAFSDFNLTLDTSRNSTPVHINPVDSQNAQSSGSLFIPVRNTFRHNSSSHHPTPYSYNQNMTEGKVYLATTQTPSNAGSSQGRRYDKFAEVYSTSGDTTEFAQHVGEYVGQKVPVCVWIGGAIFVCLVAFCIMLIGAFNLPFCNVQPMIPTFMMVFGCIIIIQSIIRIYAVLPTPSRRRKSLSRDLIMKGVEFVLIIVNVIWLILGCVWVYGSKQYVHFEEHMFEEHYCEPGLYWSAFAVCTGSLVFFALGFLVMLILVVAGASRAESSEQVLP